MFKKIMSLMLAVLVIMSVVVVSASAAQVEIADNSADAIADVAADAGADTSADAGAETAAGNKLYFEPDTAGWKNYKKVFCHLWVYGGDSFYPWQAKKEACTDNKDGKWYYDLDAKGVTLAPGTLYAVIFSNENGMQTYNLLMDSTCIGDTAYCDGTTYENPEDSSKTALAAFWRGKNPTQFGPEKCVTSIGNVVGTCVPSTTSAYAMFVDFLVNKLENARTYSGKDDQKLLDDTAAALGIGQDDIEAAIKEAGVTVDWKKAESEAPTKSDPDIKKPGNQSPAGNNGPTSGSTTKTGPETTVLFVMLGIMMAAAAVVVVARKRENG
ncbi:MAG: LPXTG cell wall anchor domain-containing protein [Ruminococcus sp.]|nr:LPXTG cell wall anchor domain-containing protein [Ruminococcus sp.]